jgi:hypothetical protein
MAASGVEDKIDILSLIAIFALESLPEEFKGRSRHEAYHYASRN